MKLQIIFIQCLGSGFLQFRGSRGGETRIISRQGPDHTFSFAAAVSLHVQWIPDFFPDFFYVCHISWYISYMYLYVYIYTYVHMITYVTYILFIDRYWYLYKLKYGYSDVHTYMPADPTLCWWNGPLLGGWGWGGVGYWHAFAIVPGLGTTLKETHLVLGEMQLFLVLIFCCLGLQQMVLQRTIIFIPLKKAPLSFIISFRAPSHQDMILEAILM